jgi:putative endonuclease
VYVSFSFKDRKLYIGYTTNLDLRFTEHQSGRVTSTKDRRPLQRIYYEVFTNQNDAKSREVFLKSGFGRNELKKALKETLIELDYKYIKCHAESD